MNYPENTWKWYGKSGHFICGEWCRFHLCTVVGPFLVSTIGEYVHPRHSGGGETAEREYLKDHPYGEEVGYQRFYETMVFIAGEPCTCGCGQPRVDGHDLDFRGYNDPLSASEGHRELCSKWAEQAAPKQE